jgi:hypothetical protein
MQAEDRRRILTTGKINLIRHEVREAMKACSRDNRLGKDYNVLWWAGRGNVPLHVVYGKPSA